MKMPHPHTQLLRYVNAEEAVASLRHPSMKHILLRHTYTKTKNTEKLIKFSAVTNCISEPDELGEGDLDAAFSEGSGVNH
jgi:hypothetical protein